MISFRWLVPRGAEEKRCSHTKRMSLFGENHQIAVGQRVLEGIFTTRSLLLHIPSSFFVP